MINLISLLCGLLFGFGLHFSGMTDPSIVLAFLTLDANWNISLMFVMGGALLVFVPGYLLVVKKQTKPLLAESFTLPTNTLIDKPLVVGAAIFGLGWGLAGICPGPAIANIVLGDPKLLAFVAAMTVGMYLAGLYQKRFSR